VRRTEENIRQIKADLKELDEIEDEDKTIEEEEDEINLTRASRKAEHVIPKMMSRMILLIQCQERT
jgi:hypothetical protein